MLPLRLKGHRNTQENRPISRPLAWLFLCAGVACIGSARVSAQDSFPGDWQQYLIPYGGTVYDVVNHVSWLADANLAKDFSFGLPLCYTTSEGTVLKRQRLYELRVRQRMGRGYITPPWSHPEAHSNWQLPTTPRDGHYRVWENPGSMCAGQQLRGDANALGYLYYKALSFEAPNTAVPIPFDIVWPFVNFQPGLYCSNTSGNGAANGIAVFSFATGAQGGSTQDDLLSLLADDPEAKIPLNASFVRHGVADQSRLADYL